MGISCFLLCLTLFITHSSSLAMSKQQPAHRPTTKACQEGLLLPNVIDGSVSRREERGHQVGSSRFYSTFERCCFWFVNLFGWQVLLHSAPIDARRLYGGRQVPARSRGLSHYWGTHGFAQFECQAAIEKGAQKWMHPTGRGLVRWWTLAHLYVCSSVRVSVCLLRRSSRGCSVVVVCARPRTWTQDRYR